MKSRVYPIECSISRWEVDVADWGELVKVLDGPRHGQSYIFRGQPDSDWTLKPRLLRDLDETRTNWHAATKVEQSALDTFRAQAHLHLTPMVCQKAQRLDWWALMQHYGAPTRMLDWTRAPYVAAYFAVDSCYGKDGAIWAVNADLLEDHQRERTESDDSNDEKAFYRKSEEPPILRTAEATSTDRMIAQQGVFTYSTQLLMDHVRPLIELEQLAKNPVRPVVRKVIIPNEMKYEILRKLKRMNITAATLFPGLDGLGQSIAQRIRIDTHCPTCFEGRKAG